MTTPPEPSLDELGAKQAMLAGANATEMQAIMQLGVMPDLAFLNRLRIDTFVTFIFSRMGNISPEVRQRLTLLFEIEYEQRLAGELKDVKAEARKATMGLGSQLSPAQIRQLWHQQEKARKRGNGGPPAGGGLIVPGS